LTVQPGTTRTITIRFAPAAASAEAATLTLASNASNAAPVVTLTGSGVGSATGPQTVVLKVDDGTFERLLTVPGVIGDYFLVNRLTPPSYPATLTKVQIFFHDEGGGPDQITGAGLVSGHAAAGAEIDGLRLRPGFAVIRRLGQFSEYDVPPLTIESGDFVVGFLTRLGPDSNPAALDMNSGFAARSYYSVDGRQFWGLGTESYAGNLGIRAVVTVGGASSPP
jgi:hypothetical protein